MNILPVVPVEVIAPAGLPGYIVPTLPEAPRVIGDLPPNIIPTFPNPTVGAKEGASALNNTGIVPPWLTDAQGSRVGDRNPGVVPPWVMPVAPDEIVDEDTPRIL